MKKQFLFILAQCSMLGRGGLDLLKVTEAALRHKVSLKIAGARKHRETADLDRWSRGGGRSTKTQTWRRNISLHKSSCRLQGFQLALLLGARPDWFKLHFSN